MTGAVRPSTSAAKIGDRSRTLISFNDLGIPKKACHIQRSCEAAASRIIVSSRQWPVYFSCHAIGHFSHFQCIQSILSNIPGNPRCSPIDNNRQISASFGALRYQSPKTSTIALTKALRLSIAVVSPIRRYSSIRSARIPYTSILWAAVIFWRQDKPRTPRASVLSLKLFYLTKLYPVIDKIYILSVYLVNLFLGISCTWDPPT